jgi:glycosyltransferase involved in cell wall biosynthesis
MTLCGLKICTEERKAMAKKIISAPLVSVVMPSLNQVQFLEAAVRSVLEQDYPNIELVVADGMSTDGSLELLGHLQAVFGGRLRWISQQDDGPAQALNRAIALAEGEIVGWLNPDDLYAPDAVVRAVEFLATRPAHQMVYGEAQLINVTDAVIGKFKTKPPSTPLDEFAHGSFICQPTVFMRREALTHVGPLDETIRTAYDFDLFVRFFKRYPGQIGIVRRVQAYSRLHAACMTHRLRRQVALDGIWVVAKELGDVPDHWFWTFVDELCARYPFEAESLPLTKQIEGFLKEARTNLKAPQLKSLVEQLKVDARLRISSPQLFATVEPDGWVGKRVTVRYRWEGKPAAAVLLRCVAPWPVVGQLKLKVKMPNGDVQPSIIDVPESFVLRFEVPECEQSGCIFWTIETAQGFVPAQHDKTSADKRKLAFQVLELKIES